jgi:hypothetical protein
MTLQFAFQRMQAEPGQVHIVRLPAAVEHSKNIPQLEKMVGRNPFLAPSFIQRFQPAIPEGTDYPLR